MILGYRIEPLASSHDRAAFSCGVPELDWYFHYQAGQESGKKVAAVYVMIDSPGMILGYYTLSAFSVRASELPDGVARKLPRYPLLRSTLLGRLAVSRSHQGKGVWRILLVDALERSFANASNVASVAVLVDAIDEKARAFYVHHGFTALRDHPNSLFLTMATIEKARRVR